MMGSITIKCTNATCTCTLKHILIHGNDNDSDDNDKALLSKLYNENHIEMQ